MGWRPWPLVKVPVRRAPLEPPGVRKAPRPIVGSLGEASDSGCGRESVRDDVAVGPPPAGGRVEVPRREEAVEAPGSDDPEAVPEDVVDPPSPTRHDVAQVVPGDVVEVAGDVAALDGRRDGLVAVGLLPRVPRRDADP